MRIIEIIPSLSYRAGAEVFFVDLCCFLNNNSNVELNVIVLYDGIDKHFKVKFDKYNIKPFFCGKRKGFDPKSNKKLKYFINTLKPDIVNTHLGCLISYFGAFGLKKYNWNLFHTCHTLAKKESSFFNFVIKKLLLRCDLLSFICISNNVKESFIKLYKTKKIYTIVNGIDIDNKNNGELVKQPRYDLIHIGRFVKIKNHKLLIKAIHSLCVENNNFRAVFLGGGPLFSKMQTMVHSLGLSDNIEFAGLVDDVTTYLSVSKVFILPSTYEGIPISILEAMSYGLPIIASEVGGIPEVVKMKRNGCLLKSLTVDNIVDAYKYVINKNNYAIISNNNLCDSTNYTMSKCANNYHKLFVESTAVKNNASNE